MENEFPHSDVYSDETDITFLSEAKMHIIYCVSTKCHYMFLICTHEKVAIQVWCKVKSELLTLISKCWRTAVIWISEKNLTLGAV